ncbi:MAG TPA: hypothetical protein VKF17_05160 [Isosphaeraceae bacterium]|nr:hypothetical protein [Isosphaeraceae bacterium]
MRPPSYRQSLLVVHYLSAASMSAVAAARPGPSPYPAQDEAE